MCALALMRRQSGSLGGHCSKGLDAGDKKPETPVGALKTLDAATLNAGIGKR